MLNRADIEAIARKSKRLDRLATIIDAVASLFADKYGLTPSQKRSVMAVMDELQKLNSATGEEWVEITVRLENQRGREQTGHRPPVVSRDKR